MSGNDNRVLELFDAVVDLPLVERKARLAALTEDVEIRRQVEAMLVADRATTGLLEQPAEAHLNALAGHTEPALDATTPPKLDQYQIVKLIGQGGMAMVYEAERIDAGFEQTVALKLIHPGMASSQWHDRFLRERQIMASLQHPHIAQLIDGGVTSTGQPFLALEYVDGVSITQFADAHQLTIEQRIDLLLDVCDAVSYAHRNLIVHRDLKPSNILVANGGVVKLLDFGIAKLLGDTDVSLTMTGQRALTPEYAAPEQFIGDVVTTATDVYALGVIMYELIVGQRPFSSASGSALEIERQVLSDGPQTLSRMTASFGVERQQAIADARGVSWNKLRRALKGDLQNIVFKALSKEAERRYPTVAQFADDLRSYLRGQPVEANASRGYKAAKFVGRHRLELGAAALVVMASMIGLASTLNQSREAQREAARAQAVHSFLIDEMISAARPEVARGRAVTVLEVLEQAAKRIDSAFADQPELEASVRQTTGEALLSLGQLDVAEFQLQASLDGLKRALGDRHPQVLKAQSLMAQLMIEQGQLTEARTMLEATHHDQRGIEGPDALSTLVTQGRLAEAERLLGHWETAQALQQEALKALAQKYPQAWQPRLAVMNGLAQTLLDLRDNPAAEGVVRHVLALQREHLGDDHPDIAHTLGRIGEFLRRKFQFDEAEAIYTEALNLRRRVLGENHPDTLRSLAQLSSISWYQGDYERNERQLRELLALRLSVLGPDHVETNASRGRLALVLRRLSRFEEAEPLYRQAIDIESKVKGPTSPDAFRQVRNLQWLLLISGQNEKALINGRRSVEICHQAVANPNLDAVQLGDLAYWLLTLDPIHLREPEVALAWAERAVEMSGRRHDDLLDTLALALRNNGRPDEAYAVLREAAALPGSMYQYAIERQVMAILVEQNRRDEADRFLREHLARRQELLAAEDFMIGWSRLWIGRNLIGMGRPEEAEQAILGALKQFRITLSEEHAHILRAKGHLASALMAQGRLSEAESLAKAAYAGLKVDQRQQGPVKRDALRRLIELYTLLEQPDQVAHWQREYDIKSKLHDRAPWS